MIFKQLDRPPFPGFHHPRPHHHHHPLPPHLRERQIQLDFDETDWTVLREVFGDEDTARAAAEIISMAPPEMQVVACQLINMIEEVA